MSLVFTKGNLTQTVSTIVQPEHNGPLYYFLLFCWRQAAGDSDFAVRFLSVIFSVLTMPLLFQWARKLLTDRTAALSVWLFAFSPFVLWFAQEARMYALHMMVSVASGLALLDAFRKGGWWRWVLYALFASTVLYSHFFGGLLIVSQVAMALLLGWRRKRRLLAYGTTMLTLGATHLPLLRLARNVVLYYRPGDIWRRFVPLDDIARLAVSHYFYRFPAYELSWLTFLLPVVLVILGGLFLFLLRRREAGVVLLHALAPVLIFYPISFKVPVYATKYTSAVVPALFVLVAWAGEALSRVWRPAGAILLVLGMLMLSGTVRDLTDPATQRADWRYVADYVDSHEGENDVVVISAFYVSHAFRRYYQGESRVLRFQADPYDPWPVYEDLAGQHERLWLVLHHDQFMAPGNQLREVADTAFPVITEQYPTRGEITLIGYQMRFLYPALPQRAHRLDTCFENELCLVGYWIDTTDSTATEELAHPPSSWIHVVLYWRRQSQVADLAFRPLVRVVDGSFDVWGGDLIRRPDLFDRYPPAEWPLDGVIETHFDLNLNPVTPPGMYHLEVSLAIEGDESRRIPVLDPMPDVPTDRFVFETVRIRPGH